MIGAYLFQMDWGHHHCCPLHNLKFYDNILDISPHQSTRQTTKQPSDVTEGKLRAVSKQNTCMHTYT